MTFWRSRKSEKRNSMAFYREKSRRKVTVLNCRELREKYAHNRRNNMTVYETRARLL